MHTLFADTFATLGRLDNVTLVMVFHPQYLESFLKTQHYLLQMDGPLPLHYRHYIGIMVCWNIKQQAETAIWQQSLVLFNSSYYCVLQFLVGKAFHQELRGKAEQVYLCLVYKFFCKTSTVCSQFQQDCEKEGKKICYKNKTIVYFWFPQYLRNCFSRKLVFVCVLSNTRPSNSLCPIICF